MKMNPEIKGLWLEELRSGKYRQCTGDLFDGEGYCCLGILENVRRRELGKRPLRAYESPIDESILYATTARWAGLEERDPKIKGTPLSAYNDEAKKTFDKIADLIEAHL